MSTIARLTGFFLVRLTHTPFQRVPLCHLGTLHQFLISRLSGVHIGGPRQREGGRMGLPSRGSLSILITYFETLGRQSGEGKEGGKKGA
jgi:hypothetical protein